MDSPCIFLGIKVKPGPIERFKLENYTLDNTVDHLKTEAEKKTNVPSSSLELIHHGKILKSNKTLEDSGVKNGEMVHVVKKKQEEAASPRATYSDAELQGLNTALRSLGCTPNAPGWTRAMQLLNEESVMNEILDVAPSLGEDCVALSILHEVELLAALGANIQTMRRGAEAHPELPAALMHLMRLERARANTAPTNDNGPAISGFAYSLEALSEEEDAEEEEGEDAERIPITHEQLAAALQSAREASLLPPARSTSASGAAGSGGALSLLELLRGSGGESSRNAPAAPASATAPAPTSSASGERNVITPEMFSEAISEAISRAGAGAAPSPMDHDTEASAVRAVITPEAFNEALTEAISRAGAGTGSAVSTPMDASARARAVRAVITPEAFNEALSEAISRVGANAGSALGTPMDTSTRASSSQSPARVAREQDFTTQLSRMHEMGLLKDSVNVRALLICSGDVNAAINLVFSGVIGDD